MNNLQSLYTITVNNSSYRSHNVNIDFPSYTVLAVSMAEAIGLMILSDFEYKDKVIYKIDKEEHFQFD